MTMTMAVELASGGGSGVGVGGKTMCTSSSGLFWRDVVWRDEDDVSSDSDDPLKPEEQDEIIDDFPDEYLCPSPIIEEGPFVLYLGDTRDARDLEKLRRLDITYIVNCSSSPSRVRPNNCHHLEIKTEDTPDFPILDLHFETFWNFVEEARKSSKKVLVHCSLGVSRSATLVIAYLMKHKAWSYHSALRQVRKQRYIIEPNKGFSKQLEEFGRKLNKETKENQNATNKLRKTTSHP